MKPCLNHINTYFTSYFHQLIKFSKNVWNNLNKYKPKKMALFKVVKGVNACVIFWIVGSNRRHFIPSMIGPFLKVTLVPEKELRVATLPIFYDMIQCEQNTSGNFVMVCWFWIKITQALTPFTTLNKAIFFLIITLV
jgi:hypothetical protein